MDPKARPLYMLSTRGPPQTQGCIQTESEGLEKGIHANGDQKKAGEAILTADKKAFEIKTMIRDKEGNYTVIKRSIQEEHITFINMYSPNIGASQCLQVLTSMKGEINNNTIIEGEFNTPLTPMDRSTKKKMNKETQTLNDTMDQLDLIDVYSTFHPKIMNFSNAPFTQVHREHSLG